MYPYAAIDPRLDRRRYFYSPFEGPAFLAAYRATRQAAQARLAVVGPGRPAVRRNGLATILAAPGTGDVDTAALLAEALAAPPAASAAWLPILVRKFEVGRALRARYGADLRPSDRTEIGLDGYARFAALLARHATADRSGPDLGTLSCLLKVGDVLCHALALDPRALSPDGAALAAEALAAELALVDGVGSPPPAVDDALDALDAPVGDADAPADGQVLSGVAVLAADTLRARAYVDRLVRIGLLPERAIVVELADAAPAAPGVTPATDLFDAGTPLADALARAAIPTTRVPAEAFEAPAVLRALDDTGADLVVVAPPAGVLLAPPFFAAPGRRYLHVHPGRLPAYRGSTPMYYELLTEGRMTATALFLDAGIDTGRVVAERSFAPPADRSAIDHAVDPWMRSVVLADVLRARRDGTLRDGVPQETGAGRTFFVIHPVLRHLAILAGDGSTGAAGGRGRSLPRVGRRGAGPRQATITR